MKRIGMGIVGAGFIGPHHIDQHFFAILFLEAGDNRQIERTEGPDDVCAVGSQQRVVRVLVAGIRESGGADTQVLTPGIGRLEIEAGDIPQRLQQL